VVARCPACSRVWDGDQCLACGHRAGEATVVVAPASLVVCLACGHRAGEATVVVTPASLVVGADRVAAPAPAAPPPAAAASPSSVGPMAEVARSAAAVSTDRRGGDDVEHLRIDQRREVPVRRPTTQAARDAALEDRFFAGASQPDDTEQVVELLTDGELVLSQKDFQARLKFIADTLGIEGRHTESIVVERAALVLREAGAAIYGLRDVSDEVGRHLVDGDEQIADDTAVVDLLDLGELLAKKRRLSAKTAMVAEACAREGRVAVAQVLLHASALLARLDAMVAAQRGD
jgi:hypothetical protein